MGLIKSSAGILLATLALLLPPASLGQQAERDDFQVWVRVADGMIFIEASMIMPATPREVWDVVTDFDNAKKFIPNIVSSFIVSRTESSMMVSQKINVGIGPFTTLVKEVRQLELHPYELIQARHLSGDMNSSDGSMRFIPEGASTRIVYRNVTVPKFWLPSFVVNGILSDEVRNRFRSFKKEILRRKEARARSAPIRDSGLPPA